MSSGIGGEVLVFTVKDPGKASQLANDLRRDAGVRVAVAVERTPDGQLRTTDGDVPADAGSATVTGGLVGALVGLLLGPLGLLLGWGVGLLSGSIVDQSRGEDDQDGLSVLSKGIAAGTTVVIAEVTDNQFPAKERAAQYDADVVSIPAETVAAEVEQARADAQAAADAARKSRNEKRKSDFDDHIHHLFGRGKDKGADQPAQ